MAKFSDNSMASIIWDELSVNLSTAISGAAVGVNSRIDASRLQGFRILKSQVFVALKDITEGEGPILIVMAHDLTATEVEETLGADPQRSGDPDLEARAMRPVWPVGLLMETVGGKTVLEKEMKIGWSFPEGTILKFYAINRDNATLTTGASMNVTAKHFGVWLRD